MASSKTQKSKTRVSVFERLYHKDGEEAREKISLRPSKSDSSIVNPKKIKNLAVSRPLKKSVSFRADQITKSEKSSRSNSKSEDKPFIVLSLFEGIDAPDDKPVQKQITRKVVGATEKQIKKSFEKKNNVAEGVKKPFKSAQEVRKSVEKKVIKNSDKVKPVEKSPKKLFTKKPEKEKKISPVKRTQSEPAIKRNKDEEKDDKKKKQTRDVKNVKKKETFRDMYNYESDFESDEGFKYPPDYYSYEDEDVLAKAKNRNGNTRQNQRATGMQMKVEPRISLSRLSQDEHLWNSNYFATSDEEEYDEYLRYSDQYHHSRKERQAAGYDSGRTHGSLLNERERQKGIFTVNDPKSGSSGKVKEVDYDEDNSGVYRAKVNKKDNQAYEVHETEETAIDLPIDARDAEEIYDEEIIAPIRKAVRELNSNVVNEEEATMSAEYPSVEVRIDERGQVHEIQPSDQSRQADVKDKVQFADGNPQQVASPEQRINWCNDMRKLKVLLLSKLHNSTLDNSQNSTQSVPNLPSDSGSTCDEGYRSSRSSDHWKTHRMGRSTPETSTSKLPRPVAHANKSSSSTASEDTRRSSTYTVESYSSLATPGRSKCSSQEDMTNADSAVFYSTDFNLSDPSILSSEECAGNSGLVLPADSSSSDFVVANKSSFVTNSGTNLAENRLPGNCLEKIFKHLTTGSKNGEFSLVFGQHANLPSVSDFPQVSSFKLNEPLVGCGDELSSVKNSNAIVGSYVMENELTPAKTVGNSQHNLVSEF